MMKNIAEFDERIVLGVKLLFACVFSKVLRQWAVRSEKSEEAHKHFCRQRIFSSAKCFERGWSKSERWILPESNGIFARMMRCADSRRRRHTSFEQPDCAKKIKRERRLLKSRN